MANSFGSYVYDTAGGVGGGAACHLRDLAETRTAKLRAAETPGKDGGYTGGGLIAPQEMTLPGVLVEAPGAGNIADLWRAFVAAHNPSLPKALTLDYFGNSRFRYAEARDVREVVQSPPLVAARAFEVAMHLADPYWYGETLNTSGAVTLAASGTTSITVTVGGTVPAAPILTVVTSDAPRVVTITDSDGNQLVLKANVAGTYVLDTRLGSIVRAGSYVYTWDGVFPQLKIGSGSGVAVVMDAGASATGTLQWRNRD